MSVLSAKEKGAFQSRRGFGKLPSLSKKDAKDPKIKKAFPLKFHLSYPVIPYHFTKKGAFIAGSVFFLLVGGATAYYYIYDFQQNPEVIYQRNVQSITKKVSKYVPLPKNEKPETATVTDVKALPHEAFFAHAQNGDKILIYKKHKLAVLYRPSTGQTITYATLDFRNMPTPTPQQPAVAGVSTSAAVISQSPAQSSPGANAAYHPDGKILIQPQ